MEEIANSVRGGRTPEQAFRSLARIIREQNLGLLKEALDEYYRQTGRIRDSDDFASLEDIEGGSWYLGPRDSDLFWPSLKELLLREKEWDADAVASIDAASTKILSMLQSPGKRVIDTRGLVVGYVQSGKTANYTAVIAKAADAGYKFFLVLSGMTNSLRAQTQRRLASELIQPNREHWVALTSEHDDFRPGPIGNVDAFLTDNQGLKVLGIVKKNAVVLRRLMRWLRAASPEVLKSCPMLVVDDEADQASINTAEYQDARSAINGLVLDILTTLPRCAYLGYTATPFANVFVDPAVPKGLYPKDFIIDLPAPAGYFGPESLFGRATLPADEEDAGHQGLDMIRRVPSEEADELKPSGRDDRYDFYPELTPSLKSALEYFWMGVAARAVRGQQNRHSSMLIHTSLYTIVQERFRPLLEGYRDETLSLLSHGDVSSEPFLERLQRHWEEEQKRLPPREMGLEPVDFEELCQHMTSVVESTVIVVENSRADDRLEYGDEARTQIVIGGNTLSRGLTLEGLLASLFVRSSTAYDTLLQMGRWFGFREGYEDLPRIWVTDELEEYFFDLATVEQEVRSDIRRYQIEGMTPLDFGVRIRTHPDLNITSRLKMQHSIPASVTYSGARLQTLLFKHKDAHWLGGNLRAARNMINSVQNTVGSPKSRRSSSLFEGVGAELVLDFLDEYTFHEDSGNLGAELLKGYIQDQNAEGELEAWNVVVKGKRHTQEDEMLSIGDGMDVPLLNRSRRITGTGDSETAHIGVLMSAGDTVADLKVDQSVVRELTEPELRAMRPPGLGLLILYPISKNSQPPADSTKSPYTSSRAPLDAVRHIVGAAFVFPEAENLTPQDYMTVDLSEVEREKMAVLLDEEEPQLID